ncbi:Hydroxymethylpyrimidine/phosphomethylpyrimidine kinase [Corynebacterium ciconiae DSM 44920]|uniref:bifunctional hydroxymethylpyrimidine kinase/phosphomethylpyrimidine kinase n=1 Tax=Corynebacterium ciconiae TaxID=227319 RepID=UPI00036D346C|nr:bifunctional hydroxymethylpyrimidine kinase/phosphomethylpyrimidine kinase [Corynebacterium ciconiae]WKD60710.1 Hydroxymethylpyrimidine/phosphomethylpyrimidine kinase [Corynebacterium ciconiae DSM 44920]
MTIDSIPRVLSIAGTDPTGGAGIQADIKAISAAGGFAMTVVTSLVSQNTQGVREIFTPPRTFLREQLEAVREDVDIDAVKIGMLGDRDTIAEVGDFLARIDTDIPVVIDPVMVASSGDLLHDAHSADALIELIPRADLITPNAHELAVLRQVINGGDPARAGACTTREESTAYAAEVAQRLGTAVVCKGGHLSSEDAGNTVITPDGSTWHTPVERINTRNTHGTGCSLSSAIATRLGAGQRAPEAVHWATMWIHEAIAHADELEVGYGHGPIHHFHQLYRQAGLIADQ